MLDVCMNTSYEASRWFELKRVMCQILRTQYAVELEALLVARMEHQNKFIAMVKTGNERQHTEYMSDSR